MLENLSSFGDVAAEEDAVLEYFLTTDAVERIEQDRAWLVLGRKGAGKTALVRYFAEGQHRNTSRALKLHDYPWQIHARRIDRGASEIEAYVSSWKYLIAVQFGSLALSNIRFHSRDSERLLAKFLDDNYGGVTPSISDILRPARIRFKSASLSPQLLGNSLGSIELERGAGDYALGSELNAASNAILAAVQDILRFNDIRSLFLHFDELDQGLSELDDKRKHMLVGLVLASRQVRREFSGTEFIVNPVVYLRSDLWEDMKFSDKNKISETRAIHLDWNRESLLGVINERLRVKLTNNTNWGKIITEPPLMRGSQKKWDHILGRTFLRPRDVIKFLNTALYFAKKRTDRPLFFINEDIVSSRVEYSAYLKRELDDEIMPHWPEWEEALQACSKIQTITFDKAAFINEYNSIKSKGNGIDGEEALAILYRFSVIGYEKRSGYGGSSWAFQYIEPEARWDNSASRFKVHLGLKEYARLREERQTDAGG